MYQHPKTAATVVANWLHSFGPASAILKALEGVPIENLDSKEGQKDILSRVSKLKWVTAHVKFLLIRCFKLRESPLSVCVHTGEDDDDDNEDDIVVVYVKCDKFAYQDRVNVDTGLYTRWWMRGNTAGLPDKELTRLRQEGVQVAEDLYSCKYCRLYDGSNYIEVFPPLKEESADSIVCDACRGKLAKEAAGRLSQLIGSPARKALASAMKAGHTPEKKAEIATKEFNKSAWDGLTYDKWQTWLQWWLPSDWKAVENFVWCQFFAGMHNKASHVDTGRLLAAAWRDRLPPYQPTCPHYSPTSPKYCDC